MFFFNVLIDVSVLTSTAISVDRLLALLVQTCCNIAASSCGHMLFLVICCSKQCLIHRAFIIP